MNRRWLTAILAVSICLLLTGCSRSGKQADQPAAGQETEAAVTRYNDVAVISGQNTCLPFENFTFTESVQLDDQGREQTVNGCGRWLRVQDVEEMPTVPYDKNMEIQVKGELSRILYGLYDEAYEPKQGGDSTVGSLQEIQLPEASEPYYVKLVLTFVEENGSSGYQYFFQVLPTGKEGNQAEKPVTAAGELNGSGEDLTLNLKLENKSGQAFSYDDNGPILFRRDGLRLKEVPVRSDVSLAQTLRALEAGAAAESEEKLGYLYGNLEPGEYRFYKKLNGTDGSGVLMVYTEFTIKETAAAGENVN